MDVGQNPLSTIVAPLAGQIGCALNAVGISLMNAVQVALFTVASTYRMDTSMTSAWQLVKRFRILTTLAEIIVRVAIWNKL